MTQADDKIVLENWDKSFRIFPIHPKRLRLDKPSARTGQENAWVDCLGFQHQMCHSFVLQFMPSK